MLRALRQGTKTGFLLKFIMFGFLLLGLCGLVFMDIGGYFRGGMGSTTVAQIGDEKISLYQFDQEAQRIVRSQNMTMEDAHQLGFTNMILDREVANNLMKSAANDLDIEISKTQIENTLGRVLDSYPMDGASRKEKLAALLTSQNISEATLVEQAKTQLQASLIKNALTSVSMLIPDLTAEAFKTYQNEYRTISSFTLTPKMVTFDKVPTDEDIALQYEMLKANYSIPEKRDVAMIFLTADLFADKIKIDEEELKSQYEERKEEFKLPERRYLTQALVNDAATAQKILTQAQKGGDLKDAVKRITGDDKAFKKEAYFEKEGLLESLAEPVFSAQDDGLLPEVYESALGFHVVNITKVEAPRQQEYDEVRAALETEAKQYETDDRLMDLLERAEDLLAAGDNIEQIAKALDLKIERFKDLGASPDDINEALMPFGIYDTESISAAIFDQDVNVVSDPIDLDTDGFLMAEVTKITEQSYKPFDEVKDDVTASWIERQEAEAIRQKASEIALSINSEEDVTFKTAAKELGSKISTYEKLTRNSDIPEGMNPDLLPQAFSVSQIGNAAYILNSETGAYDIFMIDDISYPEDIMADEEPLAVQKLQIVRPLESTVFELYQGHLFSKYNVRINQELLDYQYGKRENSFMSSIQ